MSDNISNIKIHLSEEFKFLDISLLNLYSLVQKYGRISSDGAISSSEFKKHHYFAPFLCLDLDENKFNISLRIEHGYLLLTYDENTPPPEQVLKYADAFLKTYYYTEYTPKDKQVFDKIFSALDTKNFYEDANMNNTKKVFLEIIKRVRDGEVEEIKFEKDGKFSFVPYKEESPEEMERLANLEGTICNCPKTIYKHNINVFSNSNIQVETPSEFD